METRNVALFTLFLILRVEGTSLEVKAAESPVPELLYKQLLYIACETPKTPILKTKRGSAEELQELDEELDGEIDQIKRLIELLEGVKGRCKTGYETTKASYEKTGRYTAEQTERYEKTLYELSDEKIEQQLNSKIAGLEKAYPGYSVNSVRKAALRTEKQQRRRRLLSVSQTHGPLLHELYEHFDNIKCLVGCLVEKKSLLDVFAQRLTVEFPPDELSRVQQKLRKTTQSVNEYLTASFPSGLGVDTPTKKRRTSSGSGFFEEGSEALSPTTAASNHQAAPPTSLEEQGKESKALSPVAVAESQEAASTFCSEKQGAKLIEKAMTGLMAMSLIAASLTLFTLYVRRQRRGAISSKKV